MIKPLKIAVMLGGPSAEREVSLRSGAAVVKALRSLGHDVYEVDPGAKVESPAPVSKSKKSAKTEPGWSLAPGTDVVFLALHGTYGEDGTVQTELEKIGVPYTGCDPEASRVAFDKVISKKAFVTHNVPTARFEVFDSAKTTWPRGWNPPVVLKPVRQGSSVGLQMVDRVEEFATKLTEALRYDSQVLMEEKIIGRETTVGVLGGEALPVAEVRVKQGPNDYKNKYTPGASEHFCPADFDAETTKKIQAAALAAFKAVGGRDYGRVDVMVTALGNPVVLEVNTLPGMTEVSLFPEIAAAAGMNYPQVCQRMVELAMKRKK
jgi:D-alanine-D-alanine ligase